MCDFPQGIIVRNNGFGSACLLITPYKFQKLIYTKKIWSSLLVPPSYYTFNKKLAYMMVVCMYPYNPCIKDNWSFLVQHMITSKVLPNNIDSSKQHHYFFHLMESHNLVNELMHWCMPYLISTYEAGLLCQISIITAHKQMHVICSSLFRNTIHHGNCIQITNYRCLSLKG
jgi:hypothetical protein